MSLVGVWHRMEAAWRGLARELRWCWLLTVGAAAISGAWLLATDVEIAVTGLLTVGTAAAGLLALAATYSHLRSDPRIAGVLHAAALLLLFNASGGAASYALASLALPLRDAPLAMIDAQLGFDWLALLGSVNRRPWLAWTLSTAYHTAIPQILMVVLTLSALGQLDRLSRFLAAYILAAAAVILLAALIPAAGAYVHHAPQRELFDQLEALAGTWHLADLEALRTDRLTVLDLSGMEGIITFPSFHTALALIIAQVLWLGRRARIVAVTIAILVPLSTLPIGGHYLIDVIAGAVIAAASIRIAKHLQGATSRAARRSTEASAINALPQES